MTTTMTTSKRYIVAKRVLENHTAEMLEGVLLDTQSAAALVTVYEAMSDTNKANFDKVNPLWMLVSFCFQKVVGP